MGQAAKDGNSTATILGTLQSDGVTPIAVKVNPVNNALKVIDSTTGTASTRTSAPKDVNGVSAWIGVSSADMKTPVPIAVDVNGNLLIKST